MKSAERLSCAYWKMEEGRSEERMEPSWERYAARRGECSWIKGKIEPCLARSADVALWHASR